MKSVGLHGRVLSYMVESAGLHGGIGYMVRCRVTWRGVGSFIVGVLGYMVECLVICWGYWVT